MKMIAIDLIKESLKASGFETEVKGNSIIVSLNRKINSLEVRMALEFVEINMSVVSVGSKVKVSV